MGLKAAIVPVTPFQQNCSLLWDEGTRKGVVVDPGGDVDRIMAAVAETGIAVERILLTHGHMDHAGGAARQTPKVSRQRSRTSGTPFSCSSRLGASSLIWSSGSEPSGPGTSGRSGSA